MAININMKYIQNFKYIDLDWRLASSKILSYIDENLNLFENNTSHWVNADAAVYKIPEIHEMFKPLNLNIDRISLFFQEQTNSEIHVDFGTAIRINFPILNCEYSETKFFKAIVPPKPKRQDNGEIYYHFDDETCEYVESCFLTQALIFNGGNPHRVHFKLMNQIRISCTVSFKEDITNLLIK